LAKTTIILPSSRASFASKLLKLGNYLYTIYYHPRERLCAFRVLLCSGHTQSQSNTRNAHNLSLTHSHTYTQTHSLTHSLSHTRSNSVQGIRRAKVIHSISLSRARSLSLARSLTLSLSQPVQGIRRAKLIHTISFARSLSLSLSPHPPPSPFPHSHTHTHTTKHTLIPDV
jgi:hypothetical protein